VGAVKAGTETVRVGVLKLDDETYRIKGLVIGEDGSVTGDIYSGDTVAGSLEVSSVIKNSMEVWAGTMVLDGTNYHIYIYETPRLMKTSEFKQKISDYCDENTDSECTEDIGGFCEENPSSSKCVAMLKRMCFNKAGLNDMRCRLAWKNYCGENPEAEGCGTMVAERVRSYCDKYPNVCSRMGLQNNAAETVFGIQTQSQSGTTTQTQSGTQTSSQTGKLIDTTTGTATKKAGG